MVKLKDKLTLVLHQLLECVNTMAHLKPIELSGKLRFLSKVDAMPISSQAIMVTLLKVQRLERKLVGEMILRSSRKHTPVYVYDIVRTSKKFE